MGLHNNEDRGMKPANHVPDMSFSIFVISPPDIPGKVDSCLFEAHHHIHKEEDATGSKTQHRVKDYAGPPKMKL